MTFHVRWSRGLPVILLLFCGLELGSAAPKPDDLAQVELLQNTLAAVAEHARASVVAIRASRRIATVYGLDEEATPPDDEIHRKLQDQFIPAVGSGIVIRPDGLILTNEHVIQMADPENIECVLSDGQRHTVMGIASDPRSDLAVLKINTDQLTAARLGDMSKVRQGHFAIVLGNPFGSALDSRGRPAMSFGVISAVGRELTGQLDPSGERYYGNLIQTDARINPGNSGGPLLNIKGEVIGINTAISTRSGGSEGVGYAIPIDKLTRTIIERLCQGEEVEYGLLGVSLETPTAVDREQAGCPPDTGALVKEVVYGTPAAEAELQSGDVIVEFDGEPVPDVDYLIRQVGASRVGQKVSLVYYRDKQQIRTTVMPSRRAVKGVAISYRWRGMRLANPTPEIRGKYKLPETGEGIVVIHVSTDSPAAGAGFEPGQFIQRIQDVDIKGVATLVKSLTRLNGPLKVILHNNKQLTLP